MPPVYQKSNKKLLRDVNGRPRQLNLLMQRGWRDVLEPLRPDILLAASAQSQH